MTSTSFDAIVIGGGMVGGAVAFGLALRGAKVAVFDEGDQAFRAAKANFGMVMVQGKGIGRPEYLRWTRRAAERWSELADTLRERAGVDVGWKRRGALRLCTSEADLADRRRVMEQVRAESGELGYRYRMLDRHEALALVPWIGPEIVGGSYTDYDSETTPMLVLRAFQVGVTRLGGRYFSDSKVIGIEARPRDFAIDAGGNRARAPLVVLAAGLGSVAIAGALGLPMPLRPERGQVLITERIAPRLGVPAGILRQMPEGGLLIGRSADLPGLDDRATTSAMHDMAANAVRMFPALAGVRVVRAWAGLRVMSPDAYPIYDQSEELPGAFSATCHSGVTLAAVHALDLAPAILEGRLPDAVSSFTGRRFNARAGEDLWVQTTAP